MNHRFPRETAFSAALAIARLIFIVLRGGAGDGEGPAICRKGPGHHPARFPAPFMLPRIARLRRRHALTVLRTEHAALA